VAPDHTYGRLAADLAALGRALPTSVDADSMAVAVMARVAELPAPVAARRPARLADRVISAVLVGRRRIAVAAVAVLVALALTPPVRAAVSEWFEFAGVVVRDDSAPGPSSAPDPPEAGSDMGLERAARMVAFEPLVPTALGPPSGVEVSADRRVLSMSWQDPDGRTVRLDEFDGRLDFAFAKSAPGVQFTEVAGDFAMWFDRPHEVVLLDPDGTRRTESARLAGNTLIWVDGPTTLRLEGELGLARATEIAGSVVPAR
jgi:hypothetical protein